MPCDVVIPTKGRASVLEALIDNLHETAPGVQPFFVVDPDDLETWSVLEVCWGEYEGWVQALEFAGGYPQKCNAGTKVTRNEFVLIGGDDVVFHEGWLEAGLKAFEDPAVAVVCPNDMSPNAGNNATFPFVRRSYVRSPGASWDGPNTLYHDGYVHNFSDTELWALALARRVGRYVPDCRIEHMHPSWGKGEPDETYERGGLNSRSFAKDEQLYMRRQAGWQA